MAGRGPALVAVGLHRALLSMIRSDVESMDLFQISMAVLAGLGVGLLAVTAALGATLLMFRRSAEDEDEQ
jgi:hypothetical protein